MATGGVDILIAGAGVLFLGLFASLAFERLRIPDVVLLLFAGILVGPGLGWLSADAFSAFAGPFTTLALIVILFEGGLDLKIRHLRGRFGLVTGLLMASYVVTAGAVMLVGWLVADYPWREALLVGLVLAPLSSSILIPLVSRLDILPSTRSILIVESALGDVLAVLSVTTAASIFANGGGVDVEGVGRSLGTSFLLGGALALVAGVVWLGILRFLTGRPYAYLVTFAAAILVFGLVETAGGNGVVAVLVFALVLGHATEVARFVPGLGIFRLDDRIKWFHAEISFFVRTFFFTYLGLLVTPGVLKWSVAGTALLVVVAILVVRWLLVGVIVQRRPIERKDASYLGFLIPRGLASAALATLPGVLAVAVIAPIRDLTFAVVLITNLAMTGFLLVKEHGVGRGAEVEAVFPDFADLDLEGLAEMKE